MSNELQVVGNELQVFNFNGQDTRVVMVDGEPWWVAKDVAEVLGYSSDSKVGMLFKHVPDEWKGVNPISTLGGNQDMLCLSEQGLYFFLGRSDKKDALSYQKWIAGEVVPSVRKHGMYMTQQKMTEFFTDPDTILTIVQNWKAAADKCVELENEVVELEGAKLALTEKIQEDVPFTTFGKAVQVSKNAIHVGQLAKLLKQNGIDIGQHRLFEWLRGSGYLMKQKGANWNLPTQKSMNAGLFEVSRSIINCKNNTTRTVTTTKVTGKGQIYFVNQFLSNV